MKKDFPPLNSLTAFEAAARCNSFKLAAEELNLTPAAVAYQIKKLEDSLNAELFDRLHKGVVLNNAGLDYFETITDLLTQLSKQTRRFKLAHGQPSLSVLTLHAIAEKWLMPRLAHYRENHPDSNIEIKATENPEVTAPGDIVIGFSLRSPNQANTVVFMEEEIFPVCSSHYLSRLGTELEISELSNYDVLIDAHWKQDWDQWLRQNNTAARPNHKLTLSFSLYSMVVEAAINGMGIMMGHQQLITRELQNGALVRLFKNTVPLRGYYYLVKNRQDPYSAVADQFQRWVRQQSKACIIFQDHNA